MFDVESRSSSDDFAAWFHPGPVFVAPGVPLVAPPQALPPVQPEEPREEPRAAAPREQLGLPLPPAAEPPPPKTKRSRPQRSRALAPIEVPAQATFERIDRSFSGTARVKILNWDRATNRQLEEVEDGARPADADKGKRRRPPKPLSAAEVERQRAERPRTVGECEARGLMSCCPYVSCEFHLWADVHEESGALRLNFPAVRAHEVNRMRNTCTLGVARQTAEVGEEMDWEEVGENLGISRERATQLANKALQELAVKVSRLTDGRVVTVAQIKSALAAMRSKGID
jgi:hypothetical protein